MKLKVSEIRRRVHDIADSRPARLGVDVSEWALAQAGPASGAAQERCAALGAAAESRECTARGAAAPTRNFRRAAALSNIDSSLVYR